jgi:hypothetical protein
MLIVLLSCFCANLVFALSFFAISRIFILLFALSPCIVVLNQRGERSKSTHKVPEPPAAACWIEWIGLGREFVRFGYLFYCESERPSTVILVGGRGESEASTWLFPETQKLSFFNASKQCRNQRSLCFLKERIVYLINGALQ